MSETRSSCSTCITSGCDNIQILLCLAKAKKLKIGDLTDDGLCTITDILIPGLGHHCVTVIITDKSPLRHIINQCPVNRWAPMKRFP